MPAALLPLRSVLSGVPTRCMQLHRKPGAAGNPVRPGRSVPLLCPPPHDSTTWPSHVCVLHLPLHLRATLQVQRSAGAPGLPRQHAHVRRVSGRAAGAAVHAARLPARLVLELPGGAGVAGGGRGRIGAAEVGGRAAWEAGIGGLRAGMEGVRRATAALSAGVAGCVAEGHVWRLRERVTGGCVACLSMLA